MKERITKFLVSLIIITNLFVAPTVLANSKDSFNNLEISKFKHSSCCSSKSARACCCAKECTCKVHNSTAKDDNSQEAVTVAENKIDLKTKFIPVIIHEYQELIIEKNAINLVEKLKPPNITQNIETIVIIC